MTPARFGLVLRLLGPALEFPCIGLILSGAARDRSLLGVDLEPLPYVGVALGLAMIALGLGLSVSRPQGRRRRRRSADLPGG